MRVFYVLHLQYVSPWVMLCKLYFKAERVHGRGSQNCADVKHCFLLGGKRMSVYCTLDCQKVETEINCH